MLAMVLHGMQGTPYIYQGEELGMTNADFTLDQYRDIETLNVYQERKAAGYSEAEILASIHAKSRDNARTPMQWSGEANAGFTTGLPWIAVNPNYQEIHAEQQMKDETSIFSCYQKLIALRKQYPVFIYGDFQLMYETHPDLFVYQRTWKGQKLFVYANFHGTEVAVPEWHIGDGTVLMHNYSDWKEGVLRPYEAYMVLL